MALNEHTPNQIGSTERRQSGILVNANRSGQEAAASVTSTSLAGPRGQPVEGMSFTPDNGPFRSVIYRIGSINTDGIVLDADPTTIAVLDDLKVESVAVREHKGTREILVGTDDENYGGVLCVIPTIGE